MQTVSIEGEVFYPGVYSIQSKDEHISDLIERAGGFSPYAYIKGATLIRKKIENKGENQEQFLEKLIEDNEGLNKLEKKSDEYRIGINLTKILKNKHGKHDLTLNEGDVLLVPSEKQTVEIKGEVLAPSLVRYEKGMTLSQYVNRAGGFSDKAKKKSVYVLYANGDIKSTEMSLFFKNYPEIEPGAVIIVPKKPERKSMTTGETVGIISAITTMGVLIYNVIAK